MSKYRNKRVEVDGITFDSKAEARRYGELKLTHQAGMIEDLKCQPKYILDVNGVRICTYTADFEYQENGATITEDVKSKATITYSYKLKKRLMKAIYGIDVVEVR